MNKTRDESELVWSPSCCSRCDLCLEACGKSAIRFLPGVELGRVARRTVTTIRRFHNHFCPECRTSFASAEPEARCPRCSKTKKVVEDLFQMIYRSG